MNLSNLIDQLLLIASERGNIRVYFEYREYTHVQEPERVFQLEVDNVEVRVDDAGETVVIT